MKSLFGIFFALCTLHNADGDITRFEDGTWDATFSITHDERMDHHTVLMFFMEITLNECTFRCIQHLQCRTVNYNSNQRVCELVDSDFTEDEAYQSNGWKNIGTPVKIDGGFSKWKKATPCSVSCGNGTCRFYRECDNPRPMYGGAGCEGESVKEGHCYGEACQAMAGNWTMIFGSGAHKDVYSITEDGTVMQISNGITSRLQESDHEQFPNIRRWFMVKALHGDKGAVDYIRLSRNGTLTAHVYRSNGKLKDKYKGIEKYCCKGRGYRKVDEAMIGSWNLTFSDGKFERISITSGKMKLFNTGAEEYLRRSDNQEAFPTVKGWFLVTNLHPDVWEYLRVKKDGSLEVVQFSSACTQQYQGRINKYCRKATGVKVTIAEQAGCVVENTFLRSANIGDYKSTASVTSKDECLQECLMIKGAAGCRFFYWPITDKPSCVYYTKIIWVTRNPDHYSWIFSKCKAKIPTGMVGSWNISYSNKVKGVYDIVENGSVNFNVEHIQGRHFQISDDQVNFPSHGGWFLLKNNHRGGTWEYIQLTGGGNLKVQHFCISGDCNKKFRQKLDNYCCDGAGIKRLNPKKMTDS